MFKLLIQSTARALGIQVQMTEKSLLVVMICVSVLAVVAIIALGAVALHQPEVMMTLIEAIFTVVRLF